MHYRKLWPAGSVTSSRSWERVQMIEAQAFVCSLQRTMCRAIIGWWSVVIKWNQSNMETLYQNNNFYFIFPLKSHSRVRPIPSAPQGHDSPVCLFFPIQLQHQKNLNIILNTWRQRIKKIKIGFSSPAPSLISVLWSYYFTSSQWLHCISQTIQ